MSLCGRTSKDMFATQAKFELLREKMKRDKKETSGVREDLANLDEDIRAVERGRLWVIDRAKRGLIIDDEAEGTLLNSQRELQTIQTRRKTLMGELELVDMQDTQMGQTEALLVTLADKVESADNQTKRAMVEALVQGIVLTPGENGGVKVNITYRFGQTQERITSSLIGQKT